MMKKKNTGFSMVEILISVTIFALLMIPIVSGIMSSLKMSTSSKELQYRNEFAERMMEHIKAISVDEMQNMAYFLENGADSASLAVTTETTELSWDLDGDGVAETREELTASKYTIKGKTTIGTQKTSYNYLIEVDNRYYVEKRQDNVDFIDPNNLSLGIVEDIDYRKVALIDGTILNYDAAANNAFMSKKLLALKEEDETRYQQEIQGSSSTSSIFINDNGYRLTRIEITGDETIGYTVKCKLDYLDDSDYSRGEIVSYTPYAQTFEELPNIYLMYNPCYYNSMYATDDYIAVDTSGITGDMPDVKVFIVEISSTYSKTITDYLTSQGTTPDPDNTLYRKDAMNSRFRDSCRIHLSAVVSDYPQLNKINIYHNIGDNTDSTNAPKNNTKTARTNFWYKDSSMLSPEEQNSGIRAAVDRTDSRILSFEKNIYANAKSFIAMEYSSAYSAFVGALNTATDESRGLYQVKIWLKEESAGEINPASDKPILQGTKGGNES